MNYLAKYKNYIQLVGEGADVPPLDEYIKPEIKNKKWYIKRKAIKENNTLHNIELSRKGKYGSNLSNS